MKKLTLTLRGCISGYHGSDGDGVMIDLKDETSGCQIVRVSCTYEEFAKMVTGHGTKVQAEVYTDLPFGYKAEVKKEQIEFPNLPSNHKLRLNAARKVIAEYEVDGWRGNAEDVLNRHQCMMHTGSHRDVWEITFHRHVHPETGEPYEKVEGEQK